MTDEQQGFERMGGTHPVFSAQTVPNKGLKNPFRHLPFLLFVTLLGSSCNGNGCAGNTSPTSPPVGDSPTEIATITSTPTEVSPSPTDTEFVATPTPSIPPDPTCDESACTYYEDQDGDGWGTGSAIDTAPDSPPPDGLVPRTGDCNDTDPSVHPGAEEVCDADTTDEDCNGVADDDDDGVDSSGKSDFYLDSDGDGHGDQDGDSHFLCSPPPGEETYVKNNNDCDDDNAALNPDATEVCDPTGTDENCNGLADDNDNTTDDDSKTTYYLDEDGDTYGDSENAQAVCTQPEGYAINGGDCDDDNIDFHPGAPEDCSDTHDFNCDGSTGFTDADSDGFAACLDCDDSNIAINPAAQEICDANNVDENCNLLADDLDDGVDPAGKTDFYLDSDEDGYGGENSSAVHLCDAPLDGQSYSENNNDCDDTLDNISPNASEVCDPHDIDENCNDLSDDDDNSTSEESKARYYLDEDRDEYGNASSSQTACSLPAGYADNPDDCDDTNDAISPEAEEICNELDDDCDLKIDEGFDEDNDGYYVCEHGSLDADCDDASGLVNPGIPEICNNGIDDNCLPGDCRITGEILLEGDGSTDDGSSACDTLKIRSPANRKDLRLQRIICTTQNDGGLSNMISLGNVRGGDGDELAVSSPGSACPNTNPGGVITLFEWDPDEKITKQYKSLCWNYEKGRAGQGLAMIDDFTGDGRQELLIGIPNYETSLKENRGGICVISGSDIATESSLTLTVPEHCLTFYAGLSGSRTGDRIFSPPLNPNVRGCRATTLVSAPSFGATYSGAGLMLIGATFDDLPGGEGDCTGLDDGFINLFTGSTLLEPTSGFYRAQSMLQTDMNGDGQGEILLGTSDQNRVQVYDGENFNSPATPTPTTASIIEGSSPDSLLGVAMASSDLDGDGGLEILIGDTRGTNGHGSFHLAPLPISLDENHNIAAISTLKIGMFLEEQAGTFEGNGLGRVLATNLDFDADGFQDLFMGLFSLGTDDSGGATLLYGPVCVDENGAETPCNSVDNSLDLSLLGTGTSPEAMHFITNEPSCSLGYKVRSAGDVDGDGYSDLMILAPSCDPYRGVWILYGRGE